MYDPTQTQQTSPLPDDIPALPVIPTMLVPIPTPSRRRLPLECASVIHRFRIGEEHKGYLIVGLFPDGAPGEIFIRIAKEGSTISGFADSFSIAVSMGLQYGIPLADLCKKFVGVQFEPDGMTRNPEIRFARSIVDYVFRWMEQRFVKKEPAE